VDEVAGTERAERHADGRAGELQGEDPPAVRGPDPPQHEDGLSRRGGGQARAEDQHPGQEEGRRVRDDEQCGGGSGDELCHHGDPDGVEAVGQPAAERGRAKRSEREQARGAGRDDGAPAAAVRRVGVLVGQDRPPPDHGHGRGEYQQPYPVHHMSDLGYYLLVIDLDFEYFDIEILA